MTIPVPGPTPAPQAQWFAATFPGARTVHAAARQACHFGQPVTTGEARAAWEAAADANDPAYQGTCTIRVLCRAGGCSVLPRIWRDRFSPAGLYVIRGQRAELTPCAWCAGLFTAFHAGPVPGWDRDCAACGRARPVSHYRADQRCRDGLARTCTSCRWAKRQDREWERIYGTPRPRTPAPETAP